MKVTTDSCLFGAWIASHFKRNENLGTCLDIGTGTGLLSLMLAQQLNSKITAVEIDEEAAMQADQNFKASAWNERLEVIHADVRTHFFEKKFDLIITNPPFFENELRSVNNQKNLALHDHGLKLDQLLVAIHQNLHVDGSFAILLPFSRTIYFEAIAKKYGYFISRKMLVKQTPKHIFFRSMMLFTSSQTETVIEELSIRDHDNQYTIEFKELLKDYYLAL